LHEVNWPANEIYIIFTKEDIGFYVDLLHLKGIEIMGVLL